MLFKDGLQVSTASVKLGDEQLRDWIGATLEIDAWTPQWSLLAGLARGGRRYCEAPPLCRTLCGSPENSGAMLCGRWDTVRCTD